MTEVRSALILHAVAEDREPTVIVLGFSREKDAGECRRRLVEDRIDQVLVPPWAPDFVKLDPGFLGTVTENCPECEKQLTTIRALRRELDHLQNQLDIANEEHGFEAVPFEEGSK